VKAGVYESVSDFWFKIEKLVQFEKSLAGNSVDEIFVQAYLDQNLTHKGKGLLLLTNCQPMFALCFHFSKLKFPSNFHQIWNEIGILIQTLCY
jgi:hypothetical protein